MSTNAQQNAPVTVIGTTTWGTTIALMLALRHVRVRLLARTEEEAARLREAGEHTQRLPGYPFPPSLSVTGDRAGAFLNAAAVIFAVPSNSLRENAHGLAPYLGGVRLVVSASKGLERDTTKRMSQVLAEELPDAASTGLCALSGPNLAREIVAGLPSSAVIASANPEAARQVQELLNSSSFRVYTNSDVLGVELAGALKNVVALGAGISDGLRFGDNAKAAFVARGLAEVSRLGIAAGASPATFAGLAGIGDLIATCFSSLSRNRMLGEQIARGRSLQEAVNSLGGQVAEGVDTTSAALRMGRELGVGMPITEAVYRVLFEGLQPRQAVAELMGRELRAELE